MALPPAPLEANVVLSFDASGSTDPDAGDSVVSFGWAFRAVSGQPCAVPTVASAGAVANVRFGCPGRYAVDVTATDEMGARSTATREFDVAAYDGPALLTAGADVVVDHVCTAAPLCTTRQPVTLSATTPGIAADQVSFTWTVVPPADRPLSASRRVSFSPSAAVAAPGVTIETDGDAISGDWIFGVAASDAAGLIGTAAMRVSVGNHPPSVTKTIPTPDHAFAASQFTADGEVPFTVSDEDGDPLLAPEVEWRHAGDGPSTFTGNVLQAPSRVTFIIAVPYATRDDAARLIGGAGLERTIVFAISDVDGGRTVESWPIVVGNRPPQLVSEPAPFTVDHGYDPVALEYVADAPLSTWLDPDGDPLWHTTGVVTGDPECPDVLVEAGVAHAACSLAFVGAPAVGNFAGTHTVTQAIQDPWEPATTPSTVTFTIGNRAPSIASTATYVAPDVCTISSSCCQGPPNECTSYSATARAIAATVPGRWADPDGDPLDVQVTGAGSVTPVQPLVCTPSTCALQLNLAQLSVCGTSSTTLPTTISDGLATASGGLTVQRNCP